MDSWTCSVDEQAPLKLSMKEQNTACRYGHAAWIWACSMDMDMQMGM
jgi:hypothetical protein